MSEYLQRLQERQAVAEDFDRAMVARYGAAAHDCTNWEDLAGWDYLNWLTNGVSPSIDQAKERPYEFEIDEYTGGLTKFPAPLPYSPKFLHRFCKLIIGRSNIVFTLEYLFDPSDEVDTDYLQGLLTDIEKQVLGDSQWLYSANGLGRLCPIVPDFSGQLHSLLSREKATLVVSMAEAEDKRNRDSIGPDYAWQYMKSGVPLFDCQELRDGIAVVRNWLSRQNSAAATSAPVESNTISAVNGEPEQVGIADLCIAPLTQELMADLLTKIGVLAKGGPPYKLSGPLRAKGKGRISKTVAAFEVLSGEGLFSDDREQWVVAALATYGLPIGKKALGYQYNGGPDNGSDAFDDATERAESWLKRQEQLNTDS